VTAIFLPGVIEYITNGGVGRYYSMARMLGVQANSELEAGLQLAEAVRDLMKRVGLPLNLQQAGISREQFERELGPLCDHVESDLAVGTSRRFPYREDIQRLLEYAYEGRNVDF
jgi:alcohol dehydrogenase class IV